MMLHRHFEAKRLEEQAKRVKAETKPVEAEERPAEEKAEKTVHRGRSKKSE